jgi:uncharacterized protein
MRWLELLFMHWPVKADALRELIPAGLEIDEHEGQAWLGIVPFRMNNVRPRCAPGVPGTMAFPELNVRTYVTHRGHAGVWFFSLDAASRLAVRVARRAWHLSYFDARMHVTRSGDQITYSSARTDRRSSSARFESRYRPTGPPTATVPGTLEHFLISRFALYCADRAGRIHRGEVDHVPWSLQPAEAEIVVNEMTGPLNVKLPDVPPLLHYANHVDVVAGLIRRVDKN